MQLPCWRRASLLHLASLLRAVALSCLGRYFRGRTASSQLNVPSLPLSPILCITLRKRAHGEEARNRSAFGAILLALADVTLAALFNVFLDETLEEGSDEKIRFAVIAHTASEALREHVAKPDIYGAFLLKKRLVDIFLEP